MLDDNLNLDITVELSQALWAVLQDQNVLLATIHGAISNSTASLMETLGVPGEPAVRLEAAPPVQSGSERLLHLKVNGDECRYPDTLLQRAFHYLQGLSQGVPLRSAPKRDEIMAWLTEGMVGAGDSKHSHQVWQANLGTFFSLITRVILQQRLYLLFSPAQAQVYLASLPPPLDEWDTPSKPVRIAPGYLQVILQKVVALGISVADQQTIADILKERSVHAVSSKKSGGGLLPSDLADIAEDLIAALRPNVVEIHLPVDTLRHLTTLQNDQAQGLFNLLRDGMNYELGMLYPDFRFVSDDNLRPNSFAFKINHLLGMPYVGLPPDQILVNDTPDRVKLLFSNPDVHPEPAINPANGNECSLINSQYRAQVDAAGLTTWDGIGYLILALSAEFRRHGAALLSSTWVYQQLRNLDYDFPALRKVFSQRFASPQLTRVLRALLAEDLSIRDLRGIVERLVDFDYILTDSEKMIILDERFAVKDKPGKDWLADTHNHADFVRSGMKRFISHKYTRGQSTLVVYLLDPKIESRISQNRLYGEDQPRLLNLSIEQQERILAAVKAEVGEIPSGDRRVILTTQPVRAALQELLADELPQVNVLAYTELSPEINIKPVARISLEE